MRYPILPLYVALHAGEHAKDAHEELLRIRNYSLFARRDFDISPYFAIAKPTLEHGFDYQKLHWANAQRDPGTFWCVVPSLGAELSNRLPPKAR